MGEINRFSADEYWLWRRNTKKYPWQRQYTNWEFLNYEKIRLKKLEKWFNSFKKSEQNVTLDETSFYVVPVDLNNNWDSSIAKLGNFKYVGLSAFQNTPSFLIVGLLSRDKEIPQEYKLIRIIKSKKINTHNEKINKVEPMLIVEEWEELPSDNIYLDVPFEKQIIKKILNENIINDDTVSESLQAPIVSAPFINGGLGGISLVSLSKQSPFAKEFMKTIQMMVPPEYRISLPSEKIKETYVFNYMEGINFKLAERPYSDYNILEGFCAKKMNTLTNELKTRNSFLGEYSIVSFLDSNYENPKEQFDGLLKNFANVEITIPDEVEDFKEADVDLIRFRKNIDENLWLQVVNLRQMRPATTSEIQPEINRTMKRLHDDFNVLLSDSKNDVLRENTVSQMLKPMQANIIRLAQSFARTKNKTKIDETDLSHARDLTIDNFKKLTDKHPIAIMKKNIVKRKNQNKFDLIRQTLIEDSLSLNEIYEIIKSTKLFKDIHELNEYLAWLRKKGHIIFNQEQKYQWI